MGHPFFAFMLLVVIFILINIPREALSSRFDEEFIRKVTTLAKRLRNTLMITGDVCLWTTLNLFRYIWCILCKKLKL